MTSAKKFFRFLWMSARWPLVAAVALSTMLSLVEGISLALVFPIILVLGDTGGNSASPPGPRTRLLFHLLSRTHIPRPLWLAAILCIVLISIGLLGQLNRMLDTLSMTIVTRARQTLATRVYRAILHADWAFLVTRRASDLTHVLTSELDRVGYGAACVISLLPSGLVAVLMLGVAFYMSPLLTLVVIAGFGLLIPWQRRVGREIHRSGEEISTRTAAVFHSAIERLQNLKAVKAYGAQESEARVFTRTFDLASAELLAKQRRANGSSHAFQWTSTLLLAIVILIGLGPLHLAPGTMLIFLFALMRATPRIETVQARLNDALGELPAFTHILTLLDECALHSEVLAADTPAPPLARELALRGVNFAYPPGLKPVLDGVDLTLVAGQITAVAGTSGAGKSTLADLIMGLLTPTSGSIASDGVPITRANGQSWRRHVGYVTQDTLLFHDSIRNNLLWAMPSATDADLAEAIASASAGFVYTLADGLDTVVGDRGSMLSHGQRQRIALARAFLRKPALLILDEATNSLDLDNEENILRTVCQQGARLTTLLISHRPSAVQVAARVFVLDQGRVKLSGTWSEVQQIVEGQALAYRGSAEPAPSTAVATSPEA